MKGRRDHMGRRIARGYILMGTSTGLRQYRRNLRRAARFLVLTGHAEHARGHQRRARNG